jgi:hypothetical protein
MIDINSLYVLKGKDIIDVRQEISTTIPINDANPDNILTEIPLLLYFDSYTLFIYNTWRLSDNCTTINNLKGQKLIDILLENQYLVLKLNHSSTVTVDLSDDGFIDPESLVLYGPNNFWMVWI